MNTGILYARMAITVVLSLYTTRVILNALGAGDFGIFNIVGGAIAMLTFLNSSMAAATQRFMSFAQGEGNPEKQKSIFNVSLVMHTAIAVIVLALLEGAGWVLFHSVFKIAPDRMHAAQMVYQFAAISSFFTILSVPYDAVINARENMLLFAILGVIEAVLKLVIALFIVNMAGDKLIFYGFWMAGITILLMLIRVGYCHARYAECVIAPYEHFRKDLFKQMTSFAGWSLMGSSSGMIANYGQGIVVNTFFGTIVNAAQGISAQVSGQLGAFAITMLKALNPLIAKSEGAGNRVQMVQAAMTGSKVGFSLLMLFYVPVFIEMPYLFKIWLKSPPEYAVIFCRLLLIRNLVEQLYLTLSSAIFAVGEIKGFQIVSSLLNVLPIGVTFFLFWMGMPPYTLYLVFLGYSIVMFGLILFFSRKKCGINPGEYIREVVLRCASGYLLCTALAVIPNFLLPAGFTRFFLVGVSGTISAGGTVWLLILNSTEREVVSTGIKRLYLRMARVSV